MYKTKLLQALKVMSAKEQRQFQDFVNSPYFNQKDSSKQMLSYLLSLPPEDPGLHRQRVYQAVFGKAQFDDTKLRLETSYLYQLLKRFIAQQAYEQDPFSEGLFLLSSLRERKLIRIFEIESKRLEKQLARAKVQDADYHFAQFQKESEANGMYGLQYLRRPDPHLQAKINHLDRYYLLIKLKECCEMRNRERILNTPYQLDFLPEIRDFLATKAEWLEAEPALAIYALILQLQDEEADREGKLDTLDQLLQLFARHHDQFSPQEARGMYKHAQNYCIRKLNQGDADFRMRLFQLYQQGLHNQLLLPNGKLAPTDYQNIALTAIRLGKLDWARTFAETYRSKMDKVGQENAYQMIQAHLYKAEGRNHDAIQLLQSVSFSDISFQLNARMLLFQLYYEQEAWETALYQVEAFNIFVRRNKQISPSRREAYQNQLRLSKRLILLVEKRQKLGGEEFHKDIELLHRQLQHTSQLVNRNWLVGKLQSLRMKD